MVVEAEVHLNPTLVTVRQAELVVVDREVWVYTLVMV
jgi:hypothetical protein